MSVSYPKPAPRATDFPVLTGGKPSLKPSGLTGEAAIALKTTLQRAWQTLTGGSPRQPLRDLAVLTMPRTGSSYFCDCLGTLPGVAMLGEIFNPRGYAAVVRMEGARRRFEHIVGHQLSGVDDRELHYHFLGHPVDAIATLAAASAEEHAALLVYKIISHQLERTKLEAILEQRRPEIVVLVRRRLDVWISIAKAQAIGKWHHRDTREVDVEIDIDEFIAWTEETDDWYRHVIALTGQLGLAVRVLDYDRDVARPPAEIRRSATQMLKEQGIRLPRSGGTDLRVRARQDASTDPFSKVSNGTALRDRLLTRNLLDHALSAPLADRLTPAQG